VLGIGAIAGDSVGDALGKATGPRIFTREDSLLFNRKHLYRAHAFYEKYGGKTIVLARFMPIIRTFAPVVAGVGAMRYRDFIVYNVAGGLGWVWSMLFIGYALGRYIPGVADHIDLVIVAVIILSILPGIIGGIRARAAGVVPPDSETP
jgi:membrane-associated protein